MRCRSRARRLYPRPDHSRSTSASGAQERARSVGKRRRKRRYAGTTRETCVCWSITSLTRTRYGSRVRRHGRSRPEPRYQERTSLRSVAGEAGVSYNSGTEEYARLSAEGLRPSALFIDGHAREETVRIESGGSDEQLRKACLRLRGWSEEDPLRARRAEGRRPSARS